jgi:energy-coupling factor transporter ATP-binding protein EcfA2
VKLEEVYSRFFRAFNHDYIRKANPKAEPRPWDRLPDGRLYPYIRVDIDDDITCVVGANESGKSQLLDILERALLVKTPQFAELCRYSPLYDVSQPKLLVPHVGVGLRVTGDDDVSLLREAGLAGVGQESLVRIFRESADGPLRVWIDETSEPIEIENPETLRPLLPKPFRIDPRRVLPDSVPLQFLAPDSEEIPYTPFRPGPVFAALGRFPGVGSPSLADPQATAMGKALHEAIQANSVAEEVIAQWKLARDLLVSCGGVSRAAFAEVIDAIERGDTGTAKGLQDQINTQLTSTLNLRQWWSQDEDFALQVAVGDTDVKLLITDKTQKSYSFDERSGGLKYFLSYLVQYRTHLAQFEAQDDHNARVLLMDEPDAFLSSAGQGDLLRLFHDFAVVRQESAGYQVVFVTHSPFLIDKNHPGRLRVLDKGTDHLGTRVVGQGHHNHFEPIRTALGAYVAETVFIGNCNIIVEGLADQMYLANLTADFVRLGSPTTDRIDLNEVTLVAAGSADHVTYLTFVALGRDELEPAIVVLVDGDQDGLETRADILGGLPGAKQLAEDQILVISEIDGIESDRPGGPIEIEDLVPVEVAAEACNRYASAVGLPAPLADPEAIRSKLGEDVGVFKATRDALAEAGMPLRIDKVPFAQHVSDTLVYASVADDDEKSALALSVERARSNFARLLRTLAGIQRRTMQKHQNETRARNLHGDIRRFLADHPTPRIDDVALFVESIESALDDSRESMVIKLRARSLLDDARESGDGVTIGDVSTFVSNLQTLPTAAQSPDGVDGAP